MRGAELLIYRLNTELVGWDSRRAPPCHAEGWGRGIWGVVEECGDVRGWDLRCKIEAGTMYGIGYLNGFVC